jgi:hypothetical protein
MMNRIAILKIVFALLGVWMIYIVVSTCLESNLFKEWSYLGSIPWMRATLWDFYANIAVLWAWVVYRESSWTVRIVWLVLFVGLGSIAVISYVLLRLFALNPGDGLDRVLLRKSVPASPEVA